MRRRLFRLALVAGAAAALTTTLLVGIVAAAPGSTGAVYVQSNTRNGNTVAVFRRASNGDLTPVNGFKTGGNGTGLGLGSQGAVILSPDQRHLFAVNAGSNSISSLAVSRDGLRLTLEDVAPSRGKTPISLTLHGDLLYVLNSTGVGNIAGFRVGADGSLSTLANSQRPLSDDLVEPAEVAFDAAGSVLMVTEKATSLIDTWAVDHGVPGPRTVTASAGTTPFGFAFDPAGRAVVSEAFEDADGAGAASSYDVGDQGAVQTISASVGDGQTSACWVAVTQSGRFAFVSNTGSDTISSYTVAADGALSLLDGVAAATGDGSGPQDMDVSAGSRFLYVLEPGLGMVGGFRIGSDGSLTPVMATGVLTGSAAGLAAS
jgi:6-phosphogluconolactonase (cycloisomerase 2 family)